MFCDNRSKSRPIMKICFREQRPASASGLVSMMMLHSCMRRNITECTEQYSIELFLTLQIIFLYMSLRFRHNKWTISEIVTLQISLLDVRPARNCENGSRNGGWKFYWASQIIRSTSSATLIVNLGFVQCLHCTTEVHEEEDSLQWSESKWWNANPIFWI